MWGEEIWSMGSKWLKCWAAPGHPRGDGYQQGSFRDLGKRVRWGKAHSSSAHAAQSCQAGLPGVGAHPNQVRPGSAVFEEPSILVKLFGSKVPLVGISSPFRVKTLGKPDSYSFLIKSQRNSACHCLIIRSLIYSAKLKEKHESVVGIQYYISFGCTT